MKKLILSFLFLSIVAVVSAQNVGIGTTDFTPESDALLELQSTTSGFLMPRMTAGQMNEITGPTEGLLVYQKNATKGFRFYDGSVWRSLVDNLGDHTATENIQLNDHWLSNDGGNKGIRIADDGKVGIGTLDPNASLEVDGNARITNLAGSGTRMVVADAQGDLSTQAIPSGGTTSGGFGSGTILNLNVTEDINDQNVSGVSVIRLDADNGSHDINGLTGGVAGQVICIANTDDSHKVKFKKQQGTQQFRDNLEVKEKDGALIMYDGFHWYVISKH